MTLPRWLQTRSQPVAIDDAVVVLLTGVRWRCWGDTGRVTCGARARRVDCACPTHGRELSTMTDFGKPSTVSGGRGTRRRYLRTSIDTENGLIQAPSMTKGWDVSHDSG